MSRSPPESLTTLRNSLLASQNETIDLEGFPQKSSDPWRLYVQILATFVVALSLGLGIGRASFASNREGLLCESCRLFLSRSDGHTDAHVIVPFGAVSEVWQHDLTFSQRPTPDSELAWSSLIPGELPPPSPSPALFLTGQVGRGFVHHPEIAPFISNIAVFHQLHCLVRESCFIMAWI